jgi:hypothetical protein
MSGALEAYGRPTEGCLRHKSLRLRHSRGDGRCGCVLADVRARQREGPVVLGAADAGCGRRGGVDGGDVRAGAVLLPAAAGVDAGAGAGLAVYGGAASVRPVSADGRFVIEHSGHHWPDELQASGLPPA